MELDLLILLFCCLKAGNHSDRFMFCFFMPSSPLQAQDPRYLIAYLNSLSVLPKSKHVKWSGAR